MYVHVCTYAYFFVLYSVHTCIGKVSNFRVPLHKPIIIIIAFCNWVKRRRIYSVHIHKYCTIYIYESTCVDYVPERKYSAITAQSKWYYSKSHLHMICMCKNCWQRNVVGRNKNIIVLFLSFPISPSYMYHTFNNNGPVAFLRGLLISV